MKGVINMKFFVAFLIGMVLSTAILAYDFACEREALKAAHDAAAITAGFAEGQLIVYCFSFILILVYCLLDDD